MVQGQVIEYQTEACWVHQTMCTFDNLNKKAPLATASNVYPKENVAPRVCMQWVSIHKGIVAVSSRSRHTSSQELWRVLFYAEDCPLLTHMTLNRPELLLGISLYRDISTWDSLQFFLYRNQTATLFSENLIGLAWGDTWKDKEDRDGCCYLHQSSG